MKCPFCHTPCDIGWDCGCGARAIAKEMWIDPAKPLMRDNHATDEEVVLSRFTGQTFKGIKPMLEEPAAAIVSVLRETANPLKELFHKCWGEAHDSPQYNKKNWMALQAALNERGMKV